MKPGGSRNGWFPTRLHTARASLLAPLTAVALLTCILLLAGTALAQNSAETPRSNTAEARPQRPAADEPEPEAEQASDEPTDETVADTGDDNVAEADPARPQQARRRTSSRSEADGNANGAEAGAPDRDAEGEPEEQSGPAKLPGPPPVPIGPTAPPPIRTRDMRVIPPVFYESQFSPDRPLRPGEDANEAETRGGPGAPTIAENGGLGVPRRPAGEAEPPIPEAILPSPGEIAGPSAGYEAPEMQLVIPELDPLPPPPADEDYYTPERPYILERPFPPLDEDVTEEERIARDIEESIRLIDLAREERPGERVSIPLPVGTITYRAGAVQYSRPERTITLRDEAEILFEDIAIWADLIEINDRAAIVYARGYVAVQRQNDILYADEAYLNYDTKVLELFNVEGNTGGPKIEGTLYFFARRAYGTFDRMILDDPEVTTCDPFCGSPREAHMSARKAIYSANRHITLHDVWFHVREKRVGYVPIFAVPLRRNIKLFDQEESDLQQNYGYNRSEGWFAKFAYTYYQQFTDPEKVRNGGPLVGVAKVDMTQRQGPGFGIRQDLYNPALGVTTIRTYYQQQWDWDRVQLPDGTRASAQNNIEFVLSQELNLSRALNGSLNITRRNTLIPATSVTARDQRSNTWNNTFALNYRNKSNTTRAQLRADQNVLITGGQQTNQSGQQLRRVETGTNVNLTVDHDLTDEVRLGMSQQYSSIKGRQGVTGLPADQELASNYNLTFSPKPESPLAGYNTTVRWSEQIDVDGDKNQSSPDSNRSIREEKPSIEITLPRDLIAEGAYFNDFRINLDNLVTGTRRRPEEAFRAKLRAAGGDRSQINSRSDVSSRFFVEQYFYDDGNAQYVLAPQTSYSYDSFNGWRFDTSYNLHFHQGVRFPPVSADRQTYRQNLDYVFSFTNYRSWRWRLNSGFDLRRTQIALRDENGLPTGEMGTRVYAPTPLSSSFNWDPNRTMSLTHSFSYNMLTDDWNPTRIGVTWRSPYVHPDGYYNWYVGTSADIRTNYATQFSATAVDVDWFKRYERGWSTQVTGSHRLQTGSAPENFGDLADEFIRKIVVRKVNCCTTVEAGWRVGINQFYVTAFLNALPQYPSTAESFVTSQGDRAYQLLFPSDRMFMDIQQELFGTSQAIPGLF